MTTLGAVILILSLIGLVFLYVGVIQPHFEDFKSMKDTIKRDNETYLSKNGSTSMYFPPNWNKIRDGKNFNYYLMSFDGGINWHAIDREKLFDEVVVLGLVDFVYPGLMDHLEGMDQLSKQAIEKGGLDITDSSDVKVLTNAGFTVSQK